MPVYNARNFLRESIESILRQTYTDFVFLIIDDGSTDDSQNIICSFKDSRIRFLKNKLNRGIVYTLNRGLDEIYTKYIIRMDADDIAFPTRIEELVNFMELNEDVVVCGSGYEIFGKDNKIQIPEGSHEEILAKSLFYNPMNHPTTAIRLSSIRDNGIFYSEKVPHAEDWMLWIKLMKIGRFSNIPKVLLRYRLEGQNISFKHRNTRKLRLQGVYKELFKRLGIECNEKKLTIHFELTHGTNKSYKVKDYYDWIKYLKNRNSITNGYPNKELSKQINSIWDGFFYRVASKSVSSTFEYFLISGFKGTHFRFLLGYWYSRFRSKNCD